MTRRSNGPSAEVRIRVMKRDRFQCVYCGSPGTDSELEIDHIIAVARGGSHHMSNLVTACRTCNQKKSDGDPLPRRSKDEKTGLVGKFLWTLIDSECDRHRGQCPAGMDIQYQGMVTGLHEAFALVQLFSFMDGRPTKVISIPISELLSDRCILFADNDSMLNEYELYGQRHYDWSQSKSDGHP